MAINDYIIIDGYKHLLYDSIPYTTERSIQKSKSFYSWLETRRSVREYSSQVISKEIIENLIMAASTAPSGAHKQPWTFCAVSNSELKHEIRKAVEVEERETYSNRMSERWKKDLAPLGTDHNKPFIDEAPWIIVCFKRVYEHDGDTRHNNYYVNESVGIACGFLIAAIHDAGLVTLTHTPSPMNFLTKLLNRPNNERAFLLLPIGYPKQPTYVPDLKRKAIQDVSVFYE